MAYRIRFFSGNKPFTSLLPFRNVKTTRGKFKVTVQTVVRVWIFASILRSTRGASFVLCVLYLSNCLAVPCSLVVTYWERVDLMALLYVMYLVFLYVWFDSLRPINNLSVINGRVFLGWTSTKLELMFLLKETTQWRRWGSNPRPLGLDSSTQPLSHLCFCHFPLRCPGSRVVFDCTDSWSLPSAILLLFSIVKPRRFVWASHLSTKMCLNHRQTV